MSNYLAINQNFLIENTVIGCDLYIKGYVNGLPKYVLFCRGDETFCSDRRKELIKQSINKLFIYAGNLQSYFKYQEKNLQNYLTDEKRSSEEKSHVVYHVAKYLAQDLLCDPRSGTNIERVKDWVRNAVNFIFKDKNAFSSMLRVTEHDYYTYTHSVNLSVLSLLFGRHLILNQQSLNCLGIGMLLHDLGKVDISLEILNKRGKLSKHEYEIVKRHPEDGLKHLKEKNNISKESLDVVIQHHENYDGTGYPNKIGGKDINLSGRISRIVDVYDAMTTRRSYANAKKPFAALYEMKETMLGCFDKELFKEFIYFLGTSDSRKESRRDDTLYNQKAFYNYDYISTN